MIFWAVTIVVSKYIVVMLRFDHRGEGGILPLLSLASRQVRGHRRRHGTASVGRIFGPVMLQNSPSVASYLHLSPTGWFEIGAQVVI